MERAGVVPAPGRVLLVVAAVIVGVAVLGRGFAGGGADNVVLDVPPEGQARPATLPDGTPVFVSHVADGDVHVVEAVNPHLFWGLTLLVGWCPTAGAFQQTLDGSRFDATGRFLFGPAPRDLATYAATRNADTVLVGERHEPTGRSPTGDPAVRQWCEGTVVTLGTAGDVRRVDSRDAQLVTHAPTATATLLGVPGEPIRWCDGIEGTDPPRCTRTLTTLPTPNLHGDLAWTWEGPVLGDPSDPDSVLLLAGGREEYPARQTLTRVFGRVVALTRAPGGVRLSVDRKVIFGDFFVRARALEPGEPLPRPWRMGDRDGAVIVTYTMPQGSTLREAEELLDELVDITLVGDDRVLRIEQVPGAPPLTGQSPSRRR